MHPANSFIQVRVTSQQKESIKQAARREGFNGKQLSLFIRKKLLQETSPELILLKKIYKKINGDKK